MATQKHLTLSSRITIEHLLNDRSSFKKIASELGKDCTTISKEVRNHRLFKKVGGTGHAFNNCVNRFSCDIRHLCQVCSAGCNRYCRFCKLCHSLCGEYVRQDCMLLNKPPYVCNGCSIRKKCTLEKAFYCADSSQKEYELIRSESRCGISITEDEVRRLDEIVSPLIKKGQSLNHICANNQDSIMISESTLYRYVNYNILSARNMDLPRKVKYRPRKAKKIFKVDKACRNGRTYQDFLAYINKNPDLPIVQIDSVEGKKGGKVLLTIHFVNSELMLAFLRDANDSQSVIAIFERLYWELRPDIFMQLFPLLLGDNGSEFSNPAAIEFDRQKNRRTVLFYCDPSSPFQKGAAENNHEMIRRILPKGNSFDNLTQEDVTKMMNHINSYSRKNLCNKSPYEMFSFLYGEEILIKLNSSMIPANEIILQPWLLKK